MMVSKNYFGVKLDGKKVKGTISPSRSNGEYEVNGRKKRSIYSLEVSELDATLFCESSSATSLPLPVSVKRLCPAAPPLV